MKKSFLLLLVSLTLFTCKENDIIQGDIYIKLIDVHNLYGVSESQIEKIKLVIDNQDQNQYTDSEKKSFKLYEILLNNDLINKPYFKLKLANEEIINIYTTENEYKKLNNTLETFDRGIEKISVNFKGRKISDGIFEEAIYIADKIISLEKKAGKTDWKK